ncbi:hypothetical protein VDQ05_22355, partial [Xanthomonas campestris pv. campestris]|nr:hypothetical protein [Xanthomonas campestris pv. campestris]
NRGIAALAQCAVLLNASRAQARSYKGIAVACEALRVRLLHNALHIRLWVVLAVAAAVRARNRVESVRRRSRK